LNGACHKYKAGVVSMHHDVWWAGYFKHTGYFDMYIQNNYELS